MSRKDTHTNSEIKEDLKTLGIGFIVVLLLIASFGFVAYSGYQALEHENYIPFIILSVPTVLLICYKVGEYWRFYS